MTEGFLRLLIGRAAWLHISGVGATIGRLCLRTKRLPFVGELSADIVR